MDGSIRRQIREALDDSLDAARASVNQHPSDGQIKAGNYKMGHISIMGMVISIENPKGSFRSGKDKDGHTWRTEMHNDYGYFVKTVGKDGDAIDVFLGDNLDSDKIFVVDQYINNEFDESKVMLGFNSKEAASEAYLSNYEAGWDGLGDITEVDIKKFKKWLYDGYRQRKAFAKYSRLYESEQAFSVKNMLKEEEYGLSVNVFNSTDYHRNLMVANVLAKKGFDARATEVGVTIDLERDALDDSYVDDMINLARSIADNIDNYIEQPIQQAQAVAESNTNMKKITQSQIEKAINEALGDKVKDFGHKVNNFLTGTYEGPVNTIKDVMKKCNWGVCAKLSDNSWDVFGNPFFGVEPKEFAMEMNDFLAKYGKRAKLSPMQGSQDHMVLTIVSGVQESTLRRMVRKALKEGLYETPETSDEFTPHGYKGLTNCGGNEIQLSNGGDAARIKYQDGEVTDWLEIEFDEDGIPYVTTPYGVQEKLSEYMRY